MKRTRRLISLMAVVAFLVMALVPITALAEEPPADGTETGDPPEISSITLSGIKAPVTGETPTPEDGELDPVGDYVSVYGAAGEGGGEPDPSAGAAREADGTAIPGAVSEASIAWSAASSPAERAALEAFEPETAYKAVVTLTIDTNNATLPENVANLVSLAPSQTREADPAVTTVQGTDDDANVLTVTIEFPPTEAGEATLPTIGEVTLRNIKVPEAGGNPSPPDGSLDMEQDVIVVAAPAAEDDGDTQDPAAESREADPATIDDAFSSAEIVWSEVSAQTEQAIAVFEENKQYQAVVTLTLDPENATLPEDVSNLVKLDPETEAEITTTKLDGSPAALETTIVYPATGENNLEMDNESTYQVNAQNPWIQWYAGDSTMPTLETRLAGPDPVENIVFSWTAGDSTDPIAGATGPQLTLTDALLGTEAGIKTFTASATATKNGANVEFSSAKFSVLVAPEGGITLFCPEYPEPSYGYLVGKSTAPSMKVSAIGATNGADLTYTWKDEAGIEVGTGDTFTPNAAQLGSVRATKVFTCEASSSGDAEVYLSPLQYTVEVYVNDLGITGPSSVRAGSTIDITVSAPGLLSVVGKVGVSGLQVTKVESKYTPSFADEVSQSPELGSVFQMSDAQIVMLFSAFHTEAVYTCRVTASAGQTVSFSLSDVITSDGASDIGLSNVSWSATLPGNTPVNPGGSGGGGGGGAVNPPAPTTSPSPSPSASSSPSTEPTPTAAPTAPVQLAPDVPESMKVEENPNGSGTILTGVEISTPRDTFNVTALSRMIQVPEGGSVVIREADGEQAPANARVATGMVVQVLDSNGNPIEESTVVVPGDVNGTGLMNLSQVVTMAKALTGQTQLIGVYLLAGDLDSNNRITITDIVIVAIMFKDMGMQSR